MLKVHAPAKVNLFLRVLAREETGFHQLESLFASLEFGDDVFLRAAEEGGVRLREDGPRLCPVEENLVVRAARAFFEASGVVGGVEIHLKKRIPSRAGLGGGSSDAAATLIGLRTLFPDRIPPGRLLEIAGDLGSDVPFFLSPTSLALAWGRGGRVLSLPPLPAAPVLLVLPGIEVETPLAYRLLAGARSREEKRPSPRSLTLSQLQGWSTVSPLAENDFHSVIFPAFPRLGEIFEALRRTGPLMALLAGSGGAMFGVYREVEAAEAAREDLQDGFPDDRFMVTATSESVPAPVAADPDPGSFSSGGG